MKINPRMKPTRAQSAQGFTLLELVVVVAVLVILAGLLLPKFDLFKLKANKGVAASNMTDVSRIIQTFYAQNSVYPDRWDSLLDVSGGTPALWVPGAPGTDVGLDPQLVGGPPAASPHKLTTTQLTDLEVRSLTRIGIANVCDLDAAPGAPNQSFNTGRAIIEDGYVATLNNTGVNADDDAKAIVQHIYPEDGGAVPAGKKLVALGFGSHSSAIGELVQEIPFYANTDQTQYYSRFLAIFQVSSSGSRAQLMAVVGADGDLISEEIADYYER